MNKRINIEIPGINLVGAKIQIVGTSPLLMNRASQEVRAALDDRSPGKKKPVQAKTNVSDEDVIKGKSHYCDNKTFGFPARSFKIAMMEIAKRFKDKKLPSTIVRSGVQIKGDDNGLIPIEYESMQISKEFAVYKSTGTANIATRPKFVKWGTLLDVVFNESMISLDQILYLLVQAGFAIGVGSWRPDKNGTYGTFEIGAVERYEL